MDSGDYKFSYEKYIYTPTNNSSFYNNDSSAFIKGGMLNLEEFKITLKNGTKGLYYSYLYEGNPFWTITQGSSSTKRKVIENGYTEYNTNQSYPHIDTKITEYVLPTASVVGQGTYNDPFIFAPQYKVMIKVNNSERGVIVNSSNEEVSSIEFLATESDFRQIKIKTKGKYGYIGSTCGTILNEIQASSGILVLSGVTRDTECTINFGEKPTSVILDQSQNNKIKSNPEKLYIIPEFGWYTDEFANYSLTTLITNPERIGYTYNGYYKSTSVSNACSGTLVIGTDKKLIKTKSLLDSFDNNQTLYPCYTANAYTITFDKNTGDVLNTTSKQIVFDQNYGELPTPEKTGYTFSGWYTDPDYGEKIVSTTKMDEATNHTLYAHWTPNTNTTYKVRHFLQKVGAGTEQNTTNYTETTSTSHTGTSDSTVNAPRSSYTGFAQPSTKSITINRFGTSEISYYYNRNSYTVTYEKNGRGTPSFSSRSVQFGATYPLPTISVTGYTFNGWFTAASGGTQVTSTTTLTNASHHTLYAQWTINQYTVTLNKGTGISAVSGAGTFNYNSIRNIDATVSPGYTWTGWTGYANTSTKAYSFNLPAQNVTLTANATGNPYAVVYNCNNGGQTPPAATNHIYGTASAVRTNTCSKTGFTFNGWNTSSNGSGTTVGSGANITNLTTTYNGTVTLYAQWVVNKYTVAYNCNGGSGSTASSSHTYGVYKTLTANGCSRAGYRFDGWTMSSSGSGTVYTNQQSVVNLTTSNNVTVTLYAKWTRCGSGTYLVNNTCTTCAPGKYSTGGVNSCSTCAAGTYSGSGASSCIACAAGTYSTGGASSCTTCTAGYYCPGGTNRVACPSGYTSAAGATAQNKCYISVAAGKYIASANSSTQTSCAAGTYKAAHTVNYGSTSSCSDCAAGTYSTGGAASCTTCTAGYYCPGGTNRIQCSSGYTSSAGASSCSPSYTVKTGVAGTISAGSNYRHPYSYSYASTGWMSTMQGFVGRNGTYNYSYIVTFKTPGSTNDVTEKLVFKWWVASAGSTISSETYRYAIASSTSNKGSYANATGSVSDSYQLVQGTFTWNNILAASGSANYQTLTINTTALNGGTTYYLYLWPSKQGGISVLQQQNYSLSVNYRDY